MSCFFCFSGDPLSEDEFKGKYGSALGPYGNLSNKYDITMCEAPCKEPGCCCISMVCFLPVQMYMRHKALNHVEPNSGWNNYLCCQGMFGGCCCIQPGKIGDKQCPIPCMCLEACLCPGAAVSATSGVIRQQYQLGLDEDDVKLIRCNNCLQITACLCTIISIFTPCEGDDVAAQIINLIADVLFCSVSGCTTAQCNREMDLREKMNAPGSNNMEGR